MTIDPTTKKAALFSGIIHLSTLLILVLGVVFSSLLAKKEDPYVFELVDLPESVSTFQPESVEPTPDIQIEFPDFPPVELPEPIPEPVPEEIPPPEPRPEVQKPVVEPPPVPVEKPKVIKPKPVELPKPMSKAEYDRTHTRPDPPKVTPRRQTRKIDTSKFEKDLKQSIMDMENLTLTSQTTTADTDAMKQWRSLLTRRLEALWKKSKTEGTSGKSVRVSFIISAGGGISSVKIVESSGLTELDSVGLNTVRQLSNFQPPPSRRSETVTVLLKVE